MHSRWLFATARPRAYAFRAMSRVPLESITFKRWGELLHARFRIRAGTAPEVELELVEVEPGRASGAAPAGGPRYEQFSLLFRGPCQPLLPQGTYEFDNPDAGSFEMFIVPVRQEQGAFVYQAVFALAW